MQKTFAGSGQKMQPVTGSAVWDKQEIEADDSWLFTLSSQMKAELHQAIGQFDGREVNFEQLSKADFHLPSFVAMAISMQQMLGYGRGLAKLSGFEVAQYSIEQAKLSYFAIALHLGMPVSQSYRGDYIGEVIDKQDPEDRRPYHNGGEFIMHRDPTADVTGLMSIRQGKTGGLSRVMSAATVHNVLLQEHPELMQTLYQGYPYMRTTPDRGDTELYTPYPIPVFKFANDGEFMAHYIPGFSEFYQERDQVPSDHIEVVAQAAIKHVLWDRAELYLETMLQPGDMQFVNNRFLMHARTDYEDWQDISKYRLLLRIWMQLPSLSRVPDDMQFFTNRDRADGGIAKSSATSSF
jgi:hypothetical protein